MKRGGISLVLYILKALLYNSSATLGGPHMTYLRNISVLLDITCLDSPDPALAKIDSTLISPLPVLPPPASVQDMFSWTWRSRDTYFYIGKSSAE